MYCLILYYSSTCLLQICNRIFFCPNPITYLFQSGLGSTFQPSLNPRSSQDRLLLSFFRSNLFYILQEKKERSPPQEKNEKTSGDARNRTPCLYSALISALPIELHPLLQAILLTLAIKINPELRTVIKHGPNSISEAWTVTTCMGCSPSRTCCPSQGTNLHETSCMNLPR